jgi:intracellular septation protein A
MSVQKTKKENPLLNIILNIVIPVVILTKFSDEAHLGPVNGLIIALIFPIGYGLYDFIRNRKTNIVSVLGLISVLITGVIGLLELNAQWIAVKEAAIPFVIGALILISLYTQYPLIKKLIFNDTFINTDLVYEKLASNNASNAFEAKMRKASVWLSFSFFFSATLNFILAKIIVQSPSGTTAFNEEIGRMTALSFPVIALPSTVLLMLILWNLFKSIKSLTGLEMEEIVKGK